MKHSPSGEQTAPSGVATSTMAWLGAGRGFQPAIPYVLAMLLIAQLVWSWGHLVEHVNDYWDGASTELREDFVAFYAAGDMVSAGLGWAIYQPQTVSFVEQGILGRPAGRETGLAFMNPPFVAGIFQPLTKLPYGEAQAAWCAISVLSLAASLATLWPELRRMGRVRATLFALAAAASMPVHASLIYGQLSPLVLLSWAVFYRLCTRGQDTAAGIALAGSLIKPQLAFVPIIYLITTRRWRALGGFAAGAACLAGLSVLFAGAKTTFVDYPDMLARSLGWRQQFGMNRLNMFGWNSFLNRVLPPDEQTLTLLLTLLLSGATVLLAVLVWRKQRDLDDGSRPMLALAAATILASPHMHKHDLQILILPVALLAAYRRDIAGLLVPALLLFVLPRIAIGPNLAPFVLGAVLIVVAARSLEVQERFQPAFARVRAIWPPNHARHRWWRAY